MSPSDSINGDAQALLARVRAFCFPEGGAVAEGVRAVRTTERGEIRASLQARWTPFTADQVVDATRSSFRWTARIGSNRITAIEVTDAYENGHGYLVVKAAGVIPLKKVVGPEADKGELQRYLASVVFCPPALLHHPTLEWTAVGPRTLRVRDRQDSTGASVDLDFGDDGRPVGTRAERPRIEGKQTILTPWSATCDEYREFEGIRVPTRLEVFWHLPEGPLSYFHSEVTSLTALR